MEISGVSHSVTDCSFSTVRTKPSGRQPARVRSKMVCFHKRVGFRTKPLGDTLRPNNHIHTRVGDITILMFVSCRRHRECCEREGQKTDTPSAGSTNRSHCQVGLFQCNIWSPFSFMNDTCLRFNKTCRTSDYLMFAFPLQRH